MFADTDFILALFKETDWLKENAVKVLAKEKGRIHTSMSVMIELALMCKKLNMGIFETYANVFSIFELDEKTLEVCKRAAIYIEKHGLNVFDAFHAAYCENDKIISSDSVYEKIGIERVKLEKAQQ